MIWRCAHVHKIATMCLSSQNCNDFTMWPFGFSVFCWICCAFSLLPFFFFFLTFTRFKGGEDKFYCSWDKYQCLCIVSILFMRPTVTLLKKYIKNEFYGIIYPFKNYFTTVFSVFNFQFTAIISLIQIDPISTRWIQRWPYNTVYKKKVLSWQAWIKSKKISHLKL